MKRYNITMMDRQINSPLIFKELLDLLDAFSYPEGSDYAIHVNICPLGAKEILSIKDVDKLMARVRVHLSQKFKIHPDVKIYFFVPLVNKKEHFLVSQGDRLEYENIGVAA